MLETGDQKSHTEERDQSGVVVGNFQVVDPTGNLRKLFYRVEGDSGFVITDQQLMVGFADPPAATAALSARRAAADGAQGGGDGGRQAEAAGVNQRLSSDQTPAGDSDQFEDGLFSFQPRIGDSAGGSTDFNDFTPGNGENNFFDKESFSSEKGGDSSGESFIGSSLEGGPSEGGSSSSGGVTGLSVSGTSASPAEGGSSSSGGGTGPSVPRPSAGVGQVSDKRPIQTIASQVSVSKC